MTLGNNGRPGDWLGSRGQQPIPPSSTLQLQEVSTVYPAPTPHPSTLRPWLLPEGAGGWAFRTRSVWPAGCVQLPHSGQGGAPPSSGKKTFSRVVCSSETILKTFRLPWLSEASTCPSRGDICPLWLDHLLSLEVTGRYKKWGPFPCGAHDTDTVFLILTANELSEIRDSV